MQYTQIFFLGHMNMQRKRVAFRCTEKTSLFFVVQSHSQSSQHALGHECLKWFNYLTV